MYINAKNINGLKKLGFLSIRLKIFIIANNFALF